MNKILIIGNYGVDGKLNGQSARTRTISETIEKMYPNSKIVKVSTGKINLFILFKLVFDILFSYKIIILPAQRSLKYVVKLIYFLGARKKTSYVVIGGWLAEFLSKENSLIKILKKFKCILVQIESLKKSLNSMGLENVFVLPNYRIYNDSIIIKKDKKSSLFKTVFYARVREDKGVITVIDAINSINAKNERLVELDIYGPIEGDFEKQFFDYLSKNNIKNKISYKGILNGNSNILETLSKYDCLLFPTFYVGEGFPGTILESILSHTPIIASDWKYNREIIEKDDVGVLVKPNNVEDLKDKILQFMNDKTLIKHFSSNCIKAAEFYTEDTAIKILKDHI